MFSLYGTVDLLNVWTYRCNSTPIYFQASMHIKPTSLAQKKLYVSEDLRKFGIALEVIYVYTYYSVFVFMRPSTGAKILIHY